MFIIVLNVVYCMPPEVKYYFIVFVIVAILLGLFILILAVLYSNRQAKNKLEKQALKAEFSQTLLQSQLEIREQTLQHVGRELHDNLSQVASLIKINLHTIRPEDIHHTKAKIDNTKELVRQLIGDLKALSVSLGSDRIARIGLIKALETEAERLNKTDQFKANWQYSGGAVTLDPDKEIILYRMAQELLNNIIRHSGATQVFITVTATEKLFILAISDNGAGFDVEEKKRNGGAGLQNLQNRARLINATLNIQSESGKGTRVTIELPL